MYVKIKKTIKTVQEKVVAFRGRATLCKEKEVNRLEAGKSKETEVDRLCRSTEATTVDRHRDGHPQILLPTTTEDEWINVLHAQSWKSQISLDEVVAKDDLITQGALNPESRNLSDVLQGEELESLLLLGERIKLIHEDKILDLSPPAIIPMSDTRRIRGRLSRPFDSCD